MPPAKSVNCQGAKLAQDFGNQCHHFQEDIDPQFPKPLVDEMETSIFIDTDHGHDKTTGRDATCMILFAVSAPASCLASSKRQLSVQTSEFCTEFSVLKNAVEMAAEIRRNLRSLGVD